MSARNDLESIWNHIDRRGSDECWLWTNGTAGGYGQISIAGRRFPAHRVAYQLAYGVDPGRLFVCHTCDVPRCCNPAHLFLGTAMDNKRDEQRKGRHVRGERCSRAKLTAESVVAIRARRLAGETYSSLAEAFGVTPAAVRFAVIGRTWRHV